MRSIDHRGVRPLLLVPLITAVLVLPGALQARSSAKPSEIVVHSCNAGELFAAVQRANRAPEADTIVLKAGCTYTFTSPTSEGGPPAYPLPLKDNGLPMIRYPLTVHGNGATLARDPSAPPMRFLFVLGSTAPGGVTVDHVTFRGGLSVAGGAVLAVPWDEDGNWVGTQGITITDSTFVDNALVRVEYFDPGGMGGAIAVVGAPDQPAPTVTLVNDTFTNNFTHGGPPPPDPNSFDTRSGGAVYLGSFVGESTIDNCTFTSNHTGDADGRPGPSWASGGAIASLADSLTITDSTFTNNGTGSGASGGAISMLPGSSPPSLTMERSTFDGNASGADGGAIAVWYEGTVSIENSTFSGNEAVGSGGAVFKSGEIELTVASSTVTGNSAATGGGLFDYGPPLRSTLRNTIVADNTATAGTGNCAGLLVDDGGNLRWPASDLSCVGMYGDPMLAPLADNGGPTLTMALQLGSMAIDAANDATCPLVDQRGVTRPQGPHCDIGAYELVP